MSANVLVPTLFPRGTFAGVPSHFRGWCATAAQGGATGGYQSVGRRFGDELLDLQPNDLEHEEWLTLVDRLVKQCLAREPVDRGAIQAWLRRHFAPMMRHVPGKRFESFIDGFIESFEAGEMLDGFPSEFEPVEVNLDDPCDGDGWIRAVYHRPFVREVLYQCPALGCREASRAAVEAYAKERGMSIVHQGETIAAVRDLSTFSGKSAEQ